jgi:hypothetical protein
LDEKVVRLCIEYLESIPLRGVFLPEPERARIHALTRKITMSDEEIGAILHEVLNHCHIDTRVFGNCGETVGAIHQALMDLRDRYEERGKHAPAATVAESGPNKS